MELTPQDTVTILLTVPLGKSAQGAVRPLKYDEWHRLSDWLKGRKADPASLLSGEAATVLDGWTDPTVSQTRLAELVGRGVGIGLALEKWQRAGLWVLTESNPGYPKHLRDILGSKSPPCLFGCGNKRLLDGLAIAVVGSRAASDADLEFTSELGRQVANHGFSVVSGGARGVDQHAMFGALDADGTAVGVLADSLMRSAISSRYRRHLADGNLALITPHNPEAGFNVGHAMARNRYIYCLARAAVVVCSDRGKGGTWRGAQEALREKWVPVWVKHSNAAKSGNPELQKIGAGLLPDTRELVGSWLDDLRSAATTRPRGVPDATAPGLGRPDSWSTQDTRQSTPPPCPSPSVHLYSLFLTRLRMLTTETEGGRGMKTEVIASKLGLRQSQGNAWLKQGVKEGSIKRWCRPATYAILPPPPLLAACAEPAQEGIGRAPEMFTAFLDALCGISEGQPLTPCEIESGLALEGIQVKDWLKRGEKEGKLKKLVRPKRYQLVYPQRPTKLETA